MRGLAIAFVLALAAPASAEDWSKYIDHGEPVPGVNKTAEPAAKAAKPAKATKATAAKPQAKTQAKARAKTKQRRK